MPQSQISMCAKYSDRIQKPVALAVEGADLLYLLLSQIKNRPEYDKIQLFNFGSVEDLGGWLETFKTLSDFTTVKVIGIIRDAEENASAAEQAVKGALAKFGMSIPTDSAVISLGTPKVGYLILPHGKEQGCLENCLLDAASGTPLANCASAFLNCVDTPARNSNWRAKVQVHAMIAGSSEPQITLGDSAKAGLWDFNHPSLKVIIDFIRALNDAV